MACEFLLDRLDVGSRSAAEQEDLRRHLDGCGECRALAASLDAAESADGDAFLARILDRTSGSACESARERLCAFVDGGLGTIDDTLVRAHINACSACAGLAQALHTLRVELPLLATADPGPEFSAGVLARTTRRPRPEPLADKISRWMRPLIARPRIAVEGAFVATAVILVPMITPGSPLGVVPERVLLLAQEAVPAQRIAAGHVRGMIEDLEVRLDAADPAVAVGALRDGSAHAWSALQRRIGTFSDRAASKQAGHGTDEANRDPDDAQEKR